jgi:predicted metal-dependent hydrolase
VTELLQVENLRIEVEYKQIKTLRMTIYPPKNDNRPREGQSSPSSSPPEGRIHISAPLHTPRQCIHNFVISRLAWIEKHRARFRRAPQAANPLQNGEIHFIWGIAYILELIERQGRPKIVLENGRMRMFVRPDDAYEKRQQFLDKWYRAILKEAASRMVEQWNSRLAVNVRQLYFRKMKSHWGSCNYIRHTIRLNTELAKKPPECLEYVILHEMIHIVEPSHNRNFYRLMDTYMSSWKIIRKKMNKGEL